MSARFTSFVGAGIQDVFAIGHEIRAGSTAFQGTDGFGFEVFFAGSFLDFHTENLIALQAPFWVVALEGKPFFAVGAPISFGIVTAERGVVECF